MSYNRYKVICTLPYWRFEPWPGSNTLGQGALSSLPSLLEETLIADAPVPCIGESHHMHVKETT